MDLRFAKWEVSVWHPVLSEEKRGCTAVKWWEEADNCYQGGKQGENKNLGEANQHAMAEHAGQSQ